jgi:hypothetical protein
MMGRRASRGRPHRTSARHEIAIHIDRLVLHGFDSIDGALVGAALEEVLGWHVASAGDADWSRSQAVDAIRTTTNVGPVTAQAPAALGRELAVAVHGAIGRELAGER